MFRSGTTTALRLVLGLLGAVAVVFGSVTVVTGGASIADGGAALSPSVESELRFYAAWFAAAGVVLLRAARDPLRHRTPIQWACAAVFAGACARVIGMITEGVPEPVYVALTVVEFAIPVVVLPLLSRAGSPSAD